MKTAAIINVGDLLPKGDFRVHSKFKKIVNFVNTENKILSLAFDKTYLGPNIIIVDNINIQNVEHIKNNDGKISIDTFFLTKILKYITQILALKIYIKLI